MSDIAYVAYSARYIYAVRVLVRPYTLEVEPEVVLWLDSLSDHDYGRTEFYADLLAEQAETLGEPYSRHLDGKGARVAVLPKPAAKTDHILAGPRAPCGSADGLP